MVEKDDEAPEEEGKYLGTINNDGLMLAVSQQKSTLMATITKSFSGLKAVISRGRQECEETRDGKNINQILVSRNTKRRRPLEVLLTYNILESFLSSRPAKNAVPRNLGGVGYADYGRLRSRQPKRF